MHGNEVIGREVLLSFIEYVLQTYTTNPNNPEVGKLVRESDLHIIPTMNPDGFEKATMAGLIFRHFFSHFNGSLSSPFMLQNKLYIYPTNQ